mgnify:CR=1 FL=1
MKPKSIKDNNNIREISRLNEENEKLKKEIKAVQNKKQETHEMSKLFFISY